MNPRLALYQLQADYALSQEAGCGLQALADLSAEPAEAPRWLVRGMAVLAAALFGLGLILWVAANWATLSRGVRFGLLEGLIVVLAAGGWWRPRARTPLLLLAFIAQGGALAFFGQTYQTGADPWQLFALWTALGLPFALAARSDVLWTPWALVAVTAIALWSATGVRFWHFDEADVAMRLQSWGLCLLLAALLAPLPRWQGWLGTGAWSFRLAVLLACLMIGSGALDGLLFARQVHFIFGLGLGILCAAFAALSFGARDVFALSALAFAIDALLICGLSRSLLEQAHGDPIGMFLLIGLAAALVVGLSVTLVLRLTRSAAAEEGEA